MSNLAARLRTSSEWRFLATLPRADRGLDRGFYVEPTVVGFPAGDIT